MRVKKSVSAKVEEEFPEFASEVASLSQDELKNRVVSLVESLRQIDDELKNNEKIQEAKEVLKEMTGPYRDAKKALSLKVKFLLEKLNNE